MTLQTYVNTATEIQYYKKTDTVWLVVYPINEDGTLGNGIPIKLDKQLARILARNLHYKVTIIDNK